MRDICCSCLPSVCPSFFWQEQLASPLGRTASRPLSGLVELALCPAWSDHTTKRLLSGYLWGSNRAPSLWSCQSHELTNTFFLYSPLPCICLFSASARWSQVFCHLQLRVLINTKLKEHTIRGTLKGWKTEKIVLLLGTTNLRESSLGYIGYLKD